MTERNARSLRRAILPWLAPAGGSLVAAFCVDPLLARTGVPRGLRWPADAAVVATLLLPPSIAVAAASSDDYRHVKDAFHPALLATSCAAALGATQLLARASGARPPGGAVTEVLSLLITWTAVFQHATDGQDALAERLLTVKDASDAEQLIERCRARLPRHGLVADQRVALELNLAGALITLSARTDQDDQLAEAFALVEGAAATAPPLLAFGAALRMTDGMRTKALRTGDDVGWDVALDLLTATAARVAAERSEAPGLALAARAEQLEWRSRQVRDVGERELLLTRAARTYEAALAATPERLDQHALHAAQLARLLAESGHEDLDTAIARMRAATRRLRHAAEDRDRDAARLALARLLLRRADEEPDGPLARSFLDALADGPLGDRLRGLWFDRATNDLIQAMTLCMSTSARTDEAARILPDVRDRMSARSHAGKVRWIDRQTGWMYKVITARQAGAEADRAAETALKWGDWAEARGDVDQAAAASWRWLTATAADLRRRVLEDKEPRVGKLQKRYAQAADRLVRAGRAADAAVALDRGRAVLLSERTGRARTGLEERLITAGRPDLAERWRAARAAVEHTDRAAFDRHREARDGTSRGSAEYHAVAEHDRLVAEIGALPGFADVAAPPDYDALRAAAADGPLVYLVALADHGLALVVTEHAAAPKVVRLTGLDRAWAEDAADRMSMPRRTRAAGRELARLLTELWERALEPVAAHVRTGALVTLIPVGALADLPLHASAAVPGDDGVWRDRVEGVAFRYAPNAQVLLHARRQAHEAAGDRARAHTILVADGGPPPAAGAAESAAVRSLATRTGARAIHAGADAGAVLAGLDDAGLWHFTCHGRHDQDFLLESSLMLDRALTLREVLARPRAGGRLAVLSSCWGARVDQTRRDEAVGFPSAMLQAGVAGVVSCQTDVDETAIRLLAVDLLTRVLDGTPPPRALAQAQAWLRGVTNAELHAADPDTYIMPAGTDAERWPGHRPFAEPRSWAAVSYTGA